MNEVLVAFALYINGITYDSRIMGRECKCKPEVRNQTCSITNLDNDEKWPVVRVIGSNGEPVFGKVNIKCGPAQNESIL